MIGSKNLKETEVNKTITIRVVILTENEKDSLEAREATYINKTNIAPKKIKNRIYENQKEFNESPEVTQTIVVWSNNINPIARGCSNRVNAIERVIITGDIIIIKEMQRIV